MTVLKHSTIGLDQARSGRVGSRVGRITGQKYSPIWFHLGRVYRSIPAKRRIAAEQRVQNYAHRPDVHLQSVPVTSNAYLSNIQCCCPYYCGGSSIIQRFNSAKVLWFFPTSLQTMTQSLRFLSTKSRVRVRVKIGVRVKFSKMHVAIYTFGLSKLRTRDTEALLHG